MKGVITFILLLIFTCSYGQTDKYKTLLDSAKALFKSDEHFNQVQLDSFDYTKVVALWEEVVRLDPNDPEARYFLGYAYDRSNSRDGRGIIDMDVQLVLKTSVEFEKVIALAPHYTGEKIVLDPYSKLTAVWGTMAMNYIYHNKIDSALWAFKEGKKRGGFSDVILAMNKLALDQCSENSILISSGDNLTVPLWYLQNVEGYRKDVSVVDVNMLNTVWYPRFIAENGSVSFDMPLADIDTIEYIPWTERMININDFSWLVKPAYYDTYLLRGDRVFLSLLKQNAFKRDLFFTVNFSEEARLSLGEFLSSYVYADKLTIKKKQVLSYKKYKTTITHVLELAPQLTLNKPDEMMIFDYFRLSLLSQANQLVDADKRTEARGLLSLLDQYCDEDKLPYSFKDSKLHATYIRSRVGIEK
jgi:tetratricopeptide (TPR) repeat protein